MFVEQPIYKKNSSKYIVEGKTGFSPPKRSIITKASASGALTVLR
jgi:hypothetical protein